MLAHIRRVLEKKEHCVVVVAEGAGQEILGAMGEFDASGNPVLQNFAKYLQKEMKEKLADTRCDIKYIDPTYMVRACPERCFGNTREACFRGPAGLGAGDGN